MKFQKKILDSTVETFLKNDNHFFFCLKENYLQSLLLKKKKNEICGDIKGFFKKINL